ncbi:MAG: hypothetical protein QHJ82_09530 [Verrucomicrobiota bacterium]|nr:hypothetical protein [Verrucomicrobiota bacterium]
MNNSSGVRKSAGSNVVVGKPLAVTPETVFTPLEMATMPAQTIPPASSFVF